MISNSEWLRIALAVGLMTFAFGVLPAFFLWHDKRANAREHDDADRIERVGERR